MRALALKTAVVCTILLAGSAAQACGAIEVCGPGTVVLPAYMSEGQRIGSVEAQVRQPPALERSRFTGQLRTVVFNNPSSFAGAIDPGLELVPLPRTPRFKTQGVYPTGY